MITKRHKLIPTTLMRSSSFKRDFKELFSLTDEQISRLATLGESKDGFELPEESIEDAAKSLGVDYLKLTMILSVLDFLYDHAHAAEIDEEESAKQVCEFAEQLNIKDCKAKIPVIRRLFARKEAYDQRMMADNSKSAVVPTLLDVSTACDIRAAVEPGTNKIAGYVPIALIGMELEQAVRDRRRIEFQMDEEDLDMLLRELNKVKQLLSTLKKEFSGKILTAHKSTD